MHISWVTHIRHFHRSKPPHSPITQRRRRQLICKSRHQIASIGANIRLNIFETQRALAHFAVRAITQHTYYPRQSLHTQLCASSRLIPTDVSTLRGGQHLHVVLSSSSSSYYMCADMAHLHIYRSNVRRAHTTRDFDMLSFHQRARGVKGVYIYLYTICDASARRDCNRHPPNTLVTRATPVIYQFNHHANWYHKKHARVTTCTTKKNTCNFLGVLWWVFMCGFCPTAHLVKTWQTPRRVWGQHI